MVSQEAPFTLGGALAVLDFLVDSREDSDEMCEFDSVKLEEDWHEYPSMCEAAFAEGYRGAWTHCYAEQWLTDRRLVLSVIPEYKGLDRDNVPVVVLNRGWGS